MFISDVDKCAWKITKIMWAIRHSPIDRIKILWIFLKALALQEKWLFKED